MSSLERTIFKNGSTTYHLSSRFFPKDIRQDVFSLYSFLRVADDYVDLSPPNKKEFKILRELWEDTADDATFDVSHQKTDSLNERVVKNIIQLTRKHGLETDWVDSFLGSMQADLDKKQYTSLDGSLWYVHGSAEVIGLMMTKIMNLPKQAEHYAMLQGRAFQWINFIRDIDEDTKLGRCYFSKEDLEKFGLKDLSEKTARTNTEAFESFINYQLTRYKEWQKEAQKGFKYIPKRLRIALETATEMYTWTASQIAKNPLIIYEKKLKPRKSRVVLKGLRLTLN